jgi:hypothetical protein
MHVVIFLPDTDEIFDEIEPDPIWDDSPDE